MSKMMSGSRFDHRLDRKRLNHEPHEREKLRLEAQSHVGESCRVLVGTAAFDAHIQEAELRGGVIHFKVKPACGYGEAWVSEPRVLTHTGDE